MQSLDWTDKVTDMVFHPSIPDFLLVVNVSLELMLFTRLVDSAATQWKFSHVVELEEVLHRFQCKISDSLKSRPPQLVTAESGHSDRNVVFIVTHGDCLIMYSWSHLLRLSKKPLFAITAKSLADDLDIGDDNKKRLCGSITSSAIFSKATSSDAAMGGCYRIVLGLKFGLIVLDTRFGDDWSVELSTVTSAVSQSAVKSLAACHGGGGFEARVAVVYEGGDHVSVLLVGQDQVTSSEKVPVPQLECAAWVPVKGQSLWTLVGLSVEDSSRAIVLCDNDAAGHFQEVVAVKEEAPVTERNLLAMADDAAPAIGGGAQGRHARGTVRRRLDRSFLLYDPQTAPSATMILSAMYAHK